MDSGGKGFTIVSVVVLNYCSRAVISVELSGKVWLLIVIGTFVGIVLAILAQNLKLCNQSVNMQLLLFDVRVMSFVQYFKLGLLKQFGTHQDFFSEFDNGWTDGLHCFVEKLIFEIRRVCIPNFELVGTDVLSGFVGTGVLVVDLADNEVVLTTKVVLPGSKVG